MIRLMVIHYNLLTLQTRVSTVHQIAVRWLSALSFENSLVQKIVYDVIEDVFDDVIGDVFDDVIGDLFDGIIGDILDDVTDLKTADLIKE